MTVLVDSSAILAFLNPQDPAHEAATTALRDLLAEREPLMMHSHVLIETIALVQRRLGIDAVTQLIAAIDPMIEIVWVGRDTHDAAVTSTIATGRRDVSLVDHVSFRIIREKDVRRAFTFDRDFVEFGFEIVPVR